MKLSNTHFVGVKGVGMASLALILKQAGVLVSGSDVSEQFITDTALNNAGITIFNGFSSEHVNNSELVIYSGAHGGLENIEVKSALEKGIKVISFAEGVGMIMDGTLLQRKLKGISVAGTHGKTTTTAMIATILSASDLDPSYLIGTSEIPSLANSGHYGRGEYFVVEADEYAIEPNFDKRPKFIWHKPKMAIITNIEHDHPDIFPTLDSFTDAFKSFLTNLPSDCTVILNGDDARVQKLLPEVKNKRITFGLNSGNDAVISEIVSSLSHTSFTLKAYGSDLGSFQIKVPGSHNCFNATASIIAGLETGLSIEKVNKGLEKFLGSKRRLEYKGILQNGALFYDDYAHHPTEIRKTLNTLKEIYPKKNVICIFQPHTYSRTKALFDDFVMSFRDAELLILTDIFSSAREKPDLSVSSFLLAQEVQKTHENVHFLPGAVDVVKYLTDNPPGKNDVVVTMGAGDIYKVAEQLKFEIQN